MTHQFIISLDNFCSLVGGDTVSGNRILDWEIRLEDISFDDMISAINEAKSQSSVSRAKEIASNLPCGDGTTFRGVRLTEFNLDQLIRIAAGAVRRMDREQDRHYEDLETLDDA